MMDFGDALSAMRAGFVVRRAGWNEIVLGIVRHPPLEPDGRLSILYPDGTYTPFGKLDDDLLALDWVVAGEYSFPEQQRQDFVLTPGVRAPLCPDCLQPAHDAVTVMRLEMT